MAAAVPAEIAVTITSPFSTGSCMSSSRILGEVIRASRAAQVVRNPVARGLLGVQTVGQSLGQW